MNTKESENVKVGYVLIAVLSLFLVSICLQSIVSYAAQPAMGVDEKLNSELIEIVKTLQPDDRLLVWIDINATVYHHDGYHLPADPSLYGIEQVIITFAPDMNENRLFWCLAEIQAQDVEEIMRIHWVSNMTLVRVGGSVDQSATKPKLSPGLQEIIDRALHCNGALDVLIWLQNSSVSCEKIGVDSKRIGNEIVHNVTATVEQGGGRLLADHYEGSYTLSAALPPESILRIMENPFIRKLYPNGPVIPHGLDDRAILHNSCKTNASPSLFTLGLIVPLSAVALSAFLTSHKKTKIKTLAFLVAVLILSSASLSQKMPCKIPCVQALDVSTSAINATDVWATGNRGQGVNVAVIDTGFDINHSDLAPAIVHCVNAFNWSSDDVGDQDILYEEHGTHVAGIVAGRGINNEIYRGVAWGAGLILVKVVNDSNVEPAIRWVIDHSNIYNIRVLTSSVGLVNAPKGGDGLESPASVAMDDAVELGLVTIQSAGKVPGPRKISSPGNAFNVITVGATDDKNTADISDDTFCDEFSPSGPTQYGRPKPDIVAPGALIWSARARTQDYIAFSGTSMAAPHVAGTVALMLHANPDLTPAQVKAILRQTERLNANLSGLDVNDRGHGIIDAYAAVQLAQNVNSIQTSQMYDSWDVTTPARHFDGIGKCWDYLTFVVAPPSSTFGITFRDVVYHWRDWWGAQAIDYELIYRLSAQHVWIDGTYYHLGSDMHKYLLSGPRIYYKADYGAVFMRAWFKVGNKLIMYDWFMGVDRVKTSLYFSGGSQWKTLMYIDTDVWDVTNYPYLPSTDETILIETKITGDVNLTIRDLDHTEYVQIDPPPEVYNPTMWILRHGYYGNNPDAVTYKNDEYVYNRDIVIYYQQTSENPGINIYRKGDSLPSPNNTQNDAGTGGDAGNSFNTATSISPWSYEGILCNSDPTDTDDWYQFHAESGKTISLSMTPPHAIDFDLELYDPYGDLKRGSYNGPGYSDGIAYTADSSGNWRARINISSGEAQYSFSVTVYSGAGCPFVYVWNGSDFVIDNNLLPNSAKSGGTEVEDYYRLEQNLVPSYEGDYYSLYTLRLEEFQNEHSYLDQAQLIAVDHYSNVSVAVSPFGEILTYQNPYAPFSAVDDQGHDQIELIQDIDDVYYEGYNGSYLLLNFSLVEGEIAKLVMRADPPPQKKSIHIQVLDAGNWTDVVEIIPRTYWATEIIDLSSYLPNSTEEFIVRLYFTDNHKVDFVGLDTTTQAEIDVEQAFLLMAYHSEDGLVTSKLRTDNDVYAELTPGQQITLLFAATTQNAEQRTFIIYVKGYYFTLDN